MQETKTPLTDEEKANIQLLETTDGILTGVTDPDKLIGSLVLPDGITEIDMLAFSYCFGLTSIIIPDSVTKIGENAFYGCTGLTELSVDSENPAYCSENNILYTKDKKHLIAAAGGLKGRVVLPDSITEIDMRAFQYCSGLTSIIIPDGVTRIGDMVFSSCDNLRAIVIPNSVTIIGEWAFSECTGLTGVTLPDSITEIGMLAFAYCSGLTSISIPAGVAQIGNDAFFGCSRLTELSIDSENPVYYSENNIIYTKDKKHLIAAAGGLKGRVVLPDGVTEIGACAFKWCTDLTSIVIPNTVTIIGERAFHSCWNLKTVIIESTIIKHIGEDPFKRVNADIHFTVKTDAVKAMLKKNTAIRDEQITVEPNANSL